MPTITAMESTPVCDEGVYDAEITDITEESGQFGDQLKFVWALDDVTKDDGSPLEMWFWTSLKLTPQSKLWALCEAVGVEPSLGEELDTDELINKRARLVVKHVPSGKGFQAKVTDLMKIGGKAGKGKAAPGAAATKEVCGVEGCNETVSKYTGGGSPLCASHTGDDL